MVNFHLVDNEDNDVNIIIIIELTHSKTLLENSLKIKSQPATFGMLFQPFLIKLPSELDLLLL